MKSILSLSLVFCASQAALAGKVVPATPELQSAIKSVTNGKIVKVEETHKGTMETYEVDIESANHAVKEIEVDRKNLAVLEAEGHALKPTTFKPGHGLKSLADLSGALKKYPSFAPSKWTLEKNIDGHWTYEVTGQESGAEKEYHFNAATLALVEVTND